MNVSSVPGSVSEKEYDFRSPSLAAGGPVSVTVGATLFTTTAVVYSVKPPSLSMIRPRTVKLPLSKKVQFVEALVPLPA